MPYDTLKRSVLRRPPLPSPPLPILCLCDVKSSFGLERRRRRCVRDFERVSEVLYFSSKNKSSLFWFYISFVLLRQRFDATSPVAMAMTGDVMIGPKSIFFVR